MNYNKKNLNIQTNSSFNIYNTKKNIYDLQKEENPSQTILNGNNIPSYFNTDKYFYKYFLNQQLENPQMNNLNDNYNINYSEPFSNNINYNNIYNQQFQSNNNIINNTNNNINKIQFTNANFTRRINNELLYRNNYEENSSFRKFPVNYYSNFSQKNNKLTFNSLNLDNNNNNNNNFNNINNNNFNNNNYINNNDNLNNNNFNNNYQTILNNELKELNPIEKKNSEFNLRYKYSPKKRNYWNSSEYTHEYVGYDPEFYIPDDEYYGVKSKIPYFKNIFRDGNYKSNYDKYFPKKKDKHLNNDDNLGQNRNSILRNSTIKSNENSPILNKATRASNVGEEIIFGIIEGTGEDATKSKQIMDTYIDGKDEINVRIK